MAQLKSALFLECSDEELKIASHLAEKLSTHLGQPVSIDDVLLSKNLSLLAEQQFANPKTPRELKTKAVRELVTGTSKRAQGAMTLFAQTVQKVHAGNTELTINDVANTMVGSLVAVLAQFTQTKKLKHRGG